MSIDGIYVCGYDRLILNVERDDGPIDCNVMNRVNVRHVVHELKLTDAENISRGVPRHGIEENVVYVAVPLDIGDEHGPQGTEIKRVVTHRLL